MSIGLFDDVEHPLIWRNQRAVGTVDGVGIVPKDHPRNDWAGKDFGFELKGVSTFQFAQYNKTMPMDKHLDQVADYFLSSGWELFVVMYEDKTTQAWNEWVIEASHPDMAARIEKRRQELELLNNYVDTQTLPPRLPVCAQLRGTTFQNCPFGHDRSGACARITEWPKRRRQ